MLTTNLCKLNVCGVTCSDLMSIEDWCRIHESQDLASVGQHDLRVYALNTGNRMLPSMRSVSLVSSFPVHSHMSGIDGYSFIL